MNEIGRFQRLALVAAALCVLSTLAGARVEAVTCNFTPFENKYLVDGQYKYRYRESLKKEFAPLTQECVDVFEPGELADIARMMYAFGLIDYGRPFAERLIASMTPKEDDDSMLYVFMSHARLTSDPDLIQTLIHTFESQYEITRKDLNNPSGSDAYRRYKSRNQTRVSMAASQRDIAQLHMMLGHSDTAIQSIMAIMDQHPTFTYAPALLAAAFLQTGQLDKAEFFSKYSLSASNSPLAYETLIRTYLYRGDYESARRFADKLEERNDRDALDSLYHQFSGQLELIDGDANAAMKHFNEYLNSADCLAEDFSHLALFRSIDLLSALMDENGGDLPEIESLEDQAWELVDAEDYQAAADYYTLLSMIDPQQPAYHFQLGYCYEKLKALLLSVEAYSLYLYFEPDAEDKEAIQEYLDSLNHTDSES